MTTTAGPRTIELTDRELELLVNALQIMRSDFGHDEGDVLHEVHQLLAKLTGTTAH